MVLNLEGIPQLFPHSKEFNQGLGQIRKGAGTFVVALDGSGDFDSIQEAINALPSTGGKIYIKEGTYPESAIIANKANLYILGSGITTILKGYISIAQNYVTIENIWFKPPTRLDERVLWSTQTNIAVRNCKFSNIRTRAIFNERGDYGWITGNTITDCTGDGIQIGGNKCIISENHIYGNGGNGIFTDGLTNSIILGNNCSGNTGGGIALCDNNYPSDNNTTTGNICSGNTGDGIDIWGDCNKNIISSNTCQNNGDYGIEITHATADKNILIGNICLGNTTGAIRDIGTNTHPNGVSGTTNLTLDDLNIIA